MIERLSGRKKEIFKMLADDPTLSVSKVSELLSVSEVTIRNDLNSLADEGFIVRTRGGAFPAFHPDILVRQKSDVDQKKKIAKAAAGLVEDGENIMILAGTTTSAIPRYLLGKRDIHIVSNSTLIFPYARVTPSLQVTFVGGEFRSSAEAVVGSIALQQLERFHVKTAFIGTDGFSIEKGVTATLVDNAEVAKQMTMQAERTVLVAASAKFGRAGFAHISPLSDIDTVITDRALDEAVEKKIKRLGLEVIKA